MCNCIELTDEALKSHGLKLELAFSFSMKTGSIKTFIPLHTEKVDKSDRKVKTAIFTPSYCPFCGEKQPAQTDPQDNSPATTS